MSATAWSRAALADPSPPPSAGGAAVGAGVGVGSAGAARDQAVADINAALTELSDAQKAGDFARIGQAQADLQRAVQAYQAASGQIASASPTG